MLVEVHGKGVLKGTDSLSPRSLVGVGVVLGVEHLVSLANGDVEAEPVSSGGHELGGDAIGGEPRLDGSSGLVGGFSIGLGL